MYFQFQLPKYNCLKQAKLNYKQEIQFFYDFDTPKIILFNTQKKFHGKLF